MLTAGARAMISSPSACATQPATAIMGALPAFSPAFTSRPNDRKTALSDVLDELEEIEETA